MTPKMDKPRYTCEDFRREMILNGLKKQFYSADITEEERRRLAAEIEKLEALVGMR